MSSDDIITAAKDIERELRQLADDLAGARQARYSVRSEELADRLAAAIRAAVVKSPAYEDMRKTQPSEAMAEAIAAARRRAKSSE